MAALRYRDEHNKVGYLQKPKGSDELTTAVQLIAFLKKQISDSKRPKVHECAHQLFIDDLPIAYIYSGMDNLGYVTEGKLTFYKNKFSPQWRMIYGRVMTFYQDKKAEGVETVSGLVIHMFVDKKYPLTINLIERMLDHQLEICHGTVGNELTTAVQLIAFLKKQISDSKRPEVHEWVINSPCYHNKELASPEQTAIVGLSVAGSRFPEGFSLLLTFDVQFLEGVLMKNKDAAFRDIQMICAEFSSVRVKTQVDWMLLQSSYFNPQVSTSRYVVPTGRVVVPTGRYVVPAGKVIIIVSPGRLSLVPTGRVLSPGRVK
ncbi:hypothetical protein Tco_1127919 [Tanacetum coccineum]